MSHKRFQPCIDACSECATECNHCATSCVQEEHVHHLAKCIQLDLECAAICRSAVEMMSLGSNYSRELCDLCAGICEACAGECDKHSDLKHCKACDDVCRNCANECGKMAA